MNRRSPLIPCQHCSRHVRAHETICPFCHTAREPSTDATPARGARRYTRAALIALSAAAMSASACANSSDKTDASADAANDTGSDAGMMEDTAIGVRYGLPSGDN